MINSVSQNHFFHDLLQLLSQEGSGAISQTFQLLLNKAMLRECSIVPEVKLS